MRIPEAAERWLKENGYGGVKSAQAVGGGCINNGTRLQTEAGKSFFLKTNSQAPADMFAREAEGLEALRAGDGPRVPEPHVWEAHFILMEDLSPAPRRPDYWTEFGYRLAALHLHTNPQFGFDHDNYIGSTPQRNPWMVDGYQFFTEQRLMFQVRLAHSRHLLDQENVRRAEVLCSRLPELVPAQPASLIHGDLWSGNAVTDSHGAPALIDPAAHYGWAEAELAMMALFGSFPETFARAYQEIRPLDPGYKSRFPIYNLYHLLNHLNLFGSGYLGQVVSILRHY